jgi:hypothetical protein
MSLGCSHKLQKRWGSYVRRVLSKIELCALAPDWFVINFRLPYVYGCVHVVPLSGCNCLQIYHDQVHNLYLLLGISKWVYREEVWKILSVERRLFVLSKNLQTNKPSKVGPYPSDLHEIGCKTNGKTRPVVPVMLPRPETVKRISLLKMFENC